MSIPYSQIQQTAKALLISAGALPCTIRWTSDNSTASTYILFSGGEAQNIDNRQNPTPVSGLVGQLGYLPGDIGYPPEANASSVEYYIGPVKWVKLITGVNTTMPSTIPVLYTISVR